MSISVLVEHQRSLRASPTQRECGDVNLDWRRSVQDRNTDYRRNSLQPQATDTRSPEDVCYGLVLVVLGFGYARAPHEAVWVLSFWAAVGMGFAYYACAAVVRWRAMRAAEDAERRLAAESRELVRQALRRAQSSAPSQPSALSAFERAVEGVEDDAESPRPARSQRSSARSSRPGQWAWLPPQPHTQPPPLATTHAALVAQRFHWLRGGAVQRLGSTVFGGDGRGKKATVGRSDVDDVCPICLADFASMDLVLRLRCRHVFHETCLGRWEKGTCPVCRASVAGDAALPSVSTSAAATAVPSWDDRPRSSF